MTDGSKAPRVTVIMGVYNCGDTLEEALDSLLNQDYRDFTVVICDDGSTDNTYGIALEYSERHPGRFVLLRNGRNMGLNHTLNECLRMAGGEYVARMDGDDVSLPERLGKQVAFLDSNPEYAIVSTPLIYFDSNGEWGTGKPKAMPTARDIPRRTPFAHAAAMIRKHVLDEVGGYTVDRRLLRVEDYHLWIKIYQKGYKGFNLQQPLYKARDDEEAAGRRTTRQRLSEAYVKYLAVRMLGLPAWMLAHALRPLAMTLVPGCIYSKLRKARYEAGMKDGHDAGTGGTGGME
ncbi:MAG: glycosyltransferase [Clostridia bacterium]|nr:glycosyltransferase [Clostridia bacterium]